MNGRVRDLRPGDKVEMAAPNGVFTAVFIGSSKHPKYEGFAMVVWLFPEGHPLNLKGSVDALSPLQVIEGLHIQTDAERYETLVKAVME